MDEEWIRNEKVELLFIDKPNKIESCVAVYYQAILYFLLKKLIMDTPKNSHHITCNIRCGYT